MSIASIYSSLTGQTGFIPLDIDDWRLIGSSDIPVIAVASGNGGNMASDTSPKLRRVNAATDKCLRIEWANSTSIEITQPFLYPPNMDATQTYTLNFLIGKNTNTDATCTFTADLFEGVGDTTRGGATAVLATATVTQYTRTITPTAGFPNFASVCLTPGTHTTDTIYMYAAWVTYACKLVSV
jgi:hypothetical protein